MDMIDYGRFVAALLFVLGLIALTAWLARRLRLGPGAAPGAARRLAVLETLPLDARRKLVLIARDDAEHLLLLGPEGSRLVEGGIRRRCEASGSDVPATLGAGRREGLG
jgi:flagellar protein FliO/FliZ